MYCPKCGQQQISAEVRFCSRCGLPVSGLEKWIADADASATRKEEAQVVALSPRRKGMRRGAKLMFLSVVLVPLFFGLGILVEDAIPMLFPLAVFLAGLSMTLYFRIFGEEMQTAKGQPAQPSRLGALFDRNALLPASETWMSAVNTQRVKTAELAQSPPSVTEHTTRLLDRE